MSEAARWYRPDGLSGVEALHANFERHAYRPHSHPTWTIAVMERGAAAFQVDARRERADDGECFVLEPEAVHTGVPAVPEGWAYKVLYLEPELLSAWDEQDAAAPRAARWVVFKDAALRAAMLRAHRALAEEPAGLQRDEAVLQAVETLKPHLRPGPPPARDRVEHAAVRRAVQHLRERWDEPVPLAELARVAQLSRFELVRRFTAQVGLPPHAFQTDLRVKAARDLLTRGHTPAQVALTCGFADQAHLTRTFRRTVGITPARYASARTFKTAAS
ncbi:AraC family transcriptional regulator [Solirubrobacter sp. CPCC 204708]|uniref:AraC family transcriptional regulator n=1 Tax=Solirubrobacter deserti TaxID=2282478 RepID=A0ABT4RUV4_9ACTN|nr:AraC family transcriptional regulator [Solirubrobacter deserti]MBE2317278.1 AraC family transcriptional regulator [Solirubrobacter deserti]MDA0142045.1 AraC family transcriptional regulator [Solirubrobacter deserti]